VAAVVRVLPRHWDGRRLLRFLTGLAMLALAFAAPPLSSVAPAAPVPAVSSVRLEAASPVQVDAVAGTARRTEHVEPPTAPVAVPLIIAATVIVLVAAAAPRARTVRGPPAV
jgi:hypothetical protein